MLPGRACGWRKRKCVAQSCVFHSSETEKSCWVHAQSCDHWGGCGSAPATPGICLRNLRVAASPLPESRWGEAHRVPAPSCTGRVRAPRSRGQCSRWRHLHLNSYYFDSISAEGINVCVCVCFPWEKWCASTRFHGGMGSWRGRTSSTRHGLLPWAEAESGAPVSSLHCRTWGLDLKRIVPLTGLCPCSGS